MYEVFFPFLEILVFRELPNPDFFIFLEFTIPPEFPKIWEIHLPETILKLFPEIVFTRVYKKSEFSKIIFLKKYYFL